MEELIHILSTLMSEELQPASPKGQNCFEWIKNEDGEDRFSVLPDELIIQILSLISTKDAVTTMVLSKRWRSIWTVVPKLVYKERNHGGGESISRFLNKSFELNKAPILETLCIQLGPQFPIDVEVEKWVANSVDRGLQELELELKWEAEPTTLPKSFYNCKTLVILKLSGKILVDVPSSACLSSLKRLSLVCVVYKDQDSIVTLLSSCHVLNYLYVKRVANDNVTKFVVKVPSVQHFKYTNIPLTHEGVGKNNGSLVIDLPTLKEFYFTDLSGDSCLIENMPHLDEAEINAFCYYDNKILRSISSVTSLGFYLNKEMIANFRTISFCRLITLEFYPRIFDWLEPLMLLLKSCPKLTTLRVLFGPSFVWNQPSSVPECLLSRVKVFECIEYRGTEGEKGLVAYILANSKCLEKAIICVTETFGLEEKVKWENELESMCRTSATSQLLFDYGA